MDKLYINSLNLQSFIEIYRATVSHLDVIFSAAGHDHFRHGLVVFLFARTRRKVLAWQGRGDVISEARHGPG